MSRASLRPGRDALPAVHALAGVGSLLAALAWARQLTTCLGGDGEGTTVALASLLAGLSLGALVVTRRDASWPAPLRWLGAAKLAAAAAAVLVSVSLPQLERLRAYPLRVVAAFVLLAVPSALVGAAWPLLASLWDHDDPVTAGRFRTARLAGALLGALSAGFVAVGALGLVFTGLLGAALVALAGVIVLATRDPSRPTERSSASFENPPWWFLALGWGGGLAGVMELLLWSRASSAVFGASAYTSTLVLVVFLLGLAGGTWATARAPREVTVGPILVRLHLALALTVAASAVALPAVDDLLPFYVVVRRAVAFRSWTATVLVVLLKLGLVLVAPTVLLGATVPLALRAVIVRGARASRAVGAFAWASAAGGFVGVLLASYVLVPSLGGHRALVVCSVLHLALAVGWFRHVLPPARKPNERAAWVVGAGAVAAAVVALSGRLPEDFFVGQRMSEFRVLRLDEEPHDARAVLELATDQGRLRGILSTREAFASDDPEETRAASLLGYLPSLLSVDPGEVLVVGASTGVTVAAVAREPQVRRVTVVDPSETAGARWTYFAHVNRRVWHDQRVLLVVGDGRESLARARGRYGVIAVNAPPPRVQGGAAFYSREFHGLVRGALRPGGVVAQRLALTGLSADEAWMLVRTFLGVFPDGALCVLSGGEVALVAGAPTLLPDVDRLRARLGAASVERGLRAIGEGWSGPEALTRELLALCPVQGVRLRNLAGEGPGLEDDLPSSEQFGLGLARASPRPRALRGGRYAVLAALHAPSPLAFTGLAPERLDEALRKAREVYLRPVDHDEAVLLPSP